MNTRARIVENDRIHLYFHLEYTISPTKGRKNEYHRRVSPIVRRGGRSKDIHMERINEKNTNRPSTVAA